jgi:ATP-dependent Clp protease adaptor protein ClpS
MSNWKSHPYLKERYSTGSGFENFLILHNDDIHTFDYVINSLVEVCNHDVVQAEQCTYIVHYKGKCDVMKGEYDFLQPLKEGLLQKGLTVSIE